ncbi:transmembrane protein sting [Leptinotarsa decemlineata]|uniref:transmembrane protein sting n=1 Tax=Leptinotarsa decemlineata TaxID=7539 RepID=UPI003D305740
MVHFKSLCVTQRDNKYYFPKTIPQKRGPLATELIIFLIILLLILDFFINGGGLAEVLCLYASGLLFRMFLELTHRIILMSEECYHLTSRYEGRLFGMVIDALHFNVKAAVAFVTSMVYCVWYLNTHDWSVYNSGLLRVIPFLVPNIYFMGIILQLNSCPLNDSLWLAEDNGLDYGSGMAYSFFYGYLKLILPKTGTEEKNLKELMQDYEDTNGIKFDNVYKLFILIPKSLTCFVSLKNQYSPSIDESSSLREKVITVAGVQNRVYKNAVYKIITDYKRKKYVAAEYATPLKTFKDVFYASGQHSAYYEKHKNDIILQFYLTLKKVLERTGLNEFCELIYYEDSYQEDGKTCYYDVGKIILTRLKKIKDKTE